MSETEPRPVLRTRGDANLGSRVPALPKLVAERYNEERQLLKRIDEIVDSYLANRLIERDRPAE
jgi:hypothetical protein